jgi:hypothetical protein
MLQHESPGCFKQNLEAGKPPSSNTGVYPFFAGGEIGIRPDWLRVSFRQEIFSCTPDVIGFTLYKWFEKFILNGLNVPGWRFDQWGKGQNGFRVAAKLCFGKEERASLQWGGKSQNGWVMLELRGGICSLLSDHDWIRLYRWARKFGGRINRIDIAADDKSGSFFDVFKVREDYLENPRSFLTKNQPGRLPKSTWIQSEGSTFYLGRSNSCLMHRVYQKGIQLAATVEGMQHPKWVRWEVQFQRSTKNDLDIDLLLPVSWWPAFIGSSNYLRERSGQWGGGRFIIRKIDPVIEPCERFARGLLACSEQWGGLIREGARIFGLERLCELLERNSSNPVYSDLTRYDAEAICNMLARLRVGGPAGGYVAEHASDLEDAYSW